MNTQTNPAPTKKTPPYVAYKTFISFIDSLRKAIPGRIDRSVMHTMSGGTQSHMSHALRTMNLITDSGIPTEHLKTLVQSQGEDRKKALGETLALGYPFLFVNPKIDIATATGKQLLEQFDNVGLRGDSVRRSVAFFLAAAKDANVNLSPYFAKIQSRSGPSKVRNGAPQGESADQPGQPKTNTPVPPKTRPPNGHSNNDIDWSDRLLSKFPEFDPAWTDDVKLKWFDAFDRLMKGRGI